MRHQVCAEVAAMTREAPDRTLAQPESKKRPMKTSPYLLALSLCLPISALAQHSHGAQTPYAGLQTRTIKSLSESDIKELRQGGGWGLALPAELNGMPGPVHLVELKDRIPLTAEQVQKAQALVQDMRLAAIRGPLVFSAISDGTGSQQRRGVGFVSC